MANPSYILAGIIMFGVAFFFSFSEMGGGITASVIGEGSLNQGLGTIVLLYSVFLIGLITIIIGIAKPSPYRRKKVE